jgi:hypothetical protein
VRIISTPRRPSHDGHAVDGARDLTEQRALTADARRVDEDPAATPAPDR